MSAGNTGGGTPGEGDDPFAYLYRPEDGQPQAPSGPRQPSYNQVRPVGQRTYGGQQGQGQGQRGGYGYPQPDTRYAAPETRPGGVPPVGHGGHGRRQAPEPRRNGLLIGAIAVVLAVVLGVGAAIMFSGDGDENQADGTETTAPPDDSSNDDGEGGADDEPSDEPTDEDAAGELPVAELASLQFGGGAGLQTGVANARSDDGSYITVTPNSTITWTFDLQGDPGQYYFYTGYSTVSDGQSMSFSVNGTAREDGVDLKDWATGSDEWADSWVSTFNLVDLQEGQNTIQLSCTSSCDVLIDQFLISEEQL
ncbi:carbohydrate-binding protein [Streptomyces millisiae]|uniref:Carbohydrate-binding protein n=1 Tax=Streptomyces millisiae TaxID=3075542 RepID=A0ABU2LZ90_9ACTN|nr:carbohydrate-binding protein [Streptomyces sp. DSM 44918]MDT0322907.1 carbohydrate-binding protein [Streptomyces sp. DSM 44918]